ncbi:MAG: hypothetical protein HYZ88_03555 [Candidatus Omnitrophica bacterium]|nr:hypothetical protein [Candidatus Omnitrophota bacterium]
MNLVVVALFCLLAAVGSAAQAAEPSVNFTFRKKVVLPEPSPPVASEPEPVVEPEAPAPELPPVPEPVVVTEPAPVPDWPEMPPIEPEQRVTPPTAPEPELAEPAPVPAPITELVPPPETILVEKEHSHPAGEGIQSHMISFPEPVPLRSTQMLTQRVWLDPQNPPRGIALQFIRAEAEEAGVYWEGEEEVFNPAEHEDLWYYGLLPELGQWTTLEILAEDLGLEDTQLTGIRFLTVGGRALWEKTTIKEAPPLEPASAEGENVNSNPVFTRTP